ncbi:MAG: putative metal-binding motif-containing protein [Pseudomonadota bacterium]
MSRPASTLLALLLTACGTEVDISTHNTAPEASLAGNPSALTWGSVATFSGTVADNEQGTEALSTTWVFTSGNGQPLELELGDDCEAPPADSANLQGRVACTFRAPSDLDLLAVSLYGSDGRRTGDPATLEVTLDPGASPTCTLTAPPAEPPDGAWFADIDILVDGACADAPGETAPADLGLCFRTTYQNAQGQAVTEDFCTGDDDTAAPALTLDATSSEARLWGYLLLPTATHQLCLFAQDEAGNDNGNDACTTLTVLPPNLAPWCELTLPVDGTAGRLGDTVRLQGLVGDPDQGVSTLFVQWRTDQSATPLGTSTPDAEGHVGLDVVLGTTPAVHTLTLYVEDDWEGNEVCQATFTVGDGPSATILSPLDGDLIDIAEVLVLEGEWHDDQTGCEELSIQWVSSLLTDPLYEGPPPSGGCSDIILWDPAVDGALPEGAHLLYLYVTDGDGYTNADSAWFEVGDCTREWYRDLDADGYGDDAIVLRDCTQPTGYVAIPGDCDDSNVAINPGAVEQCNGLDDNCDGTVDGGFHLVTFYRDADGDGYGDDAEPYPDLVCSSATLSGYTSLGGDCDDTQPDINPGEPELCDDTDHDCDGDIDNGLAYPYGTVFYLDADGDGYGASSTTGCAAWTGWILTGGDCDDTDATIHPAATEVCDTTPVDNDCDGDADPFGASGCATRYLDADGDGYGTSAGTSACVCLSNPGDYTATNTGDCDDATYSVNPGVDEVCDPAATDEDCDGYAETEGALGCSLFYYDADGDNYYASGAAGRCLCAEDGDYRGHISGDCDESDPAINPGAAEICDGYDNDCDGLTDDDDSSVSGGSTWYRDADGDGYGLATVTITRCDLPSGYVADSSDCDDNDAGDHPGATEIVGNGDDEDCDGAELCYDDDDNDGYLDATGDTRASTDPDCSDAYEGQSTDPVTDCDDTNPVIHPGATETTGDSVDVNCDGAELCYDDDDDDGYLDTSGDTRTSTDPDCADAYEGTSTDPTTDCDDTDDYNYPGAFEYCDGEDNDCDGDVDGLSEISVTTNILQDYSLTSPTSYWGMIDREWPSAGGTCDTDPWTASYSNWWSGFMYVDHHCTTGTIQTVMFQSIVGRDTFDQYYVMEVGYGGGWGTASGGDLALTVGAPWYAGAYAWCNITPTTDGADHTERCGPLYVPASAVATYSNFSLDVQPGYSGIIYIGHVRMLRCVGRP